MITHCLPLARGSRIPTLLIPELGLSLAGGPAGVGQPPSLPLPSLAPNTHTVQSPLQRRTGFVQASCSRLSRLFYWPAPQASRGEIGNKPIRYPATRRQYNEDGDF